MITNATLVRIDTPNAPNSRGDATLVTGAAMSCRCLVSDPTQADLAKDWGHEKTGNQIFRVKLAELVWAMSQVSITDPLQLGQYLTITTDPPVIVTTTYRIVKVALITHKSMSMAVASLQQD